MDIRKIIKEEVEDSIVRDILKGLPLTESDGVSDSVFDKILDKVKKYAKRGLLTATIITSLLGSTNFSQAQQSQIKQIASIEQSVGETQSHEKEVKKLIKQGYEYEVGSKPISRLDAIANKLGKEVKRIEGKSSKELNVRQNHIMELSGKHNMKNYISLYNASTNTLVIYFI